MFVFTNWVLSFYPFNKNRGGVRAGIATGLLLCLMQMGHGQTCNIVTNGTFAGASGTGWTNSGGWTFPTSPPNLAINYTDGASNQSLSQTVTGLNGGPVANEVTLTLDIYVQNANNSTTGSTTATLLVKLGGTTYLTVSNPANNTPTTAVTSNGATITNWTDVPSTNTAVTRAAVKLKIPWSAQPNAAALAFVFTASNVSGQGGDDFGIANLNIQGTCPLDSDADGIPNSVDIDNDNDGIPDAAECANQPAALNAAWTGSGATWNSNFGLTTVQVNYAGALANMAGGTMDKTGFSNPAVNTAFRVYFEYATGTANTGTVTFTFGNPVLNPILHIAGIGGMVGTTPLSSLFTLGGGLTWTELAKSSVRSKAYRRWLPPNAGRG